MNEHKYELGQKHNKHSFVRHIKLYIAGLLFIVPFILMALFFLTPIFVEPDTTPATSEVGTSYQAPSFNIFRTPYFQFQANKVWAENKRDTRDGQYVYQAFRDGLVEHDLTIYVNPNPNTLSRLKSSRVQPVNPKVDGGVEVIGDISSHCKTNIKTVNQDPRTVTHDNITFTCHVDGSIFDVLIGKSGGGTIIETVRPDGSAIKYAMYYRDLRAFPDGRELSTILRSFQAR